jgi:hypothetical protein
MAHWVVVSRCLLNHSLSIGLLWVVKIKQITSLFFSFFFHDKGSRIKKKKKKLQKKTAKQVS